MEPVGVATFGSSSENLAAFTVVNFDVFGVDGQWEGRMYCVPKFNASSCSSDAFIEVRFPTLLALDICSEGRSPRRTGILVFKFRFEKDLRVAMGGVPYPSISGSCNSWGFPRTALR